jgi:hypothetical protein
MYFLFLTIDQLFREELGLVMFVEDLFSMFVKFIGQALEPVLKRFELLLLGGELLFDELILFVLFLYLLTDLIPMLNGFVEEGHPRKVCHFCIEGFNHLNLDFCKQLLLIGFQGLFGGDVLFEGVDLLGEIFGGLLYLREVGLEGLKLLLKERNNGIFEGLLIKIELFLLQITEKFFH